MSSERASTGTAAPVPSPNTSKASSGSASKPVATGSSSNANKNIKNAILVRRNQKNNPLLKMFHNVAWEYDDILADYEVGRTTGVLFLSLKYHRLHPEYCYGRIQALEKRYHLRVLLILCDVGEQHEQPIRELTKSCLINEMTIVVAWSFEECAQYIQTYKAYENRPPDMIKERVDKDYNSILRASLTSIKGVNKTDVTTLRTHFGSFSRIAHASPAELGNCPGIGPTKVRRLREALDMPFQRSSSSYKPATTSTTLDKGKGKAPMDESPDETPSTSTAASRLRPPAAPRRIIGEEDDTNAPSSRLRAARRSPSPDWDIELDLNASDSDSELPPTRVLREAQPPPWEMEAQNESATRRLPASSDAPTRPPREPSPDWDIDVDAIGNDDDSDP